MLRFWPGTELKARLQVKILGGRYLRRGLLFHWQWPVCPWLLVNDQRVWGLACSSKQTPCTHGPCTLQKQGHMCAYFCFFNWSNTGCLLVDSSTLGLCSCATPVHCLLTACFLFCLWLTSLDSGRLFLESVSLPAKVGRQLSEWRCWSQTEGPWLHPQNSSQKSDIMCICNISTLQWDGRHRQENGTEAQGPASLEHTTTQQQKQERPCLDEGEGGSWLLKIVLWAPRAHCGTCHLRSYTHMQHVHTLNE